MKPPSAHARRGCIPWNGLLLAVSLLTFWNLPTTAHLTFESVPFNAAEGTDVLLLVHNVTGDLLGYGWYRGERVENNQLIASCRVYTQVNTPGPAHSGRGTIYPNGSLLIQTVTQNDTGYYTLLITKNDLQTERLAGQLRVYPVLPTPVITSNNSNPKELEDTVVLTCGPETPNTSHMWRINNQSLPNSTRLELSEDNRTLTLFHVTRNDTGPNMCETRNPLSVSRSDPFTLNVFYPVAQPSIEASNTTVTEHENTVVLTCRTNDTGISVSWFFSDQSLLLTEKMTLSPDNSTLSIDPVRREDAGDYWCEVSNPSSSSIGDPVTVVVLWRENGPALSMEVLTVIAIGVLVRVALVAALGFLFSSRGVEALVEKGGLHSLLGKGALLVPYFDTNAVTSSSGNPQDNPDLSEGQWPE
ncbi:LOW QUALITY PROTEIN: carcinoembryonic antigen-related cell adhesion molecule 7 [Balaenoptera acutorostrata]|uniref:LOW QUALITY PROTEIN: carcinoembryonic antigen-related cell adhesion molecule 7 n=1 Tax=Balaenoptera acutorostrata TaxID=9767 RepID=A0A383Z0J0_BALAC|nr:LOW QUALITY PROTEIN: carcinoembryonic antigen-related cell adhesion molecule 7 [Balaenoptera acutorostrata]